MLLSYYIISSILEYFIFFYVSHDFVTCVTIIYDIILYSLSKSKIKKSKSENQNKWEKNKEENK